MPTYNFRDENTGDEWSEMMSMAEREVFLKENPEVVQIPSSITLVHASMNHRQTRTDSGWKDNLRRISDAHPNSNLAEKYGDKSVKASASREAMKKWRKKKDASA